MKVFTTKEIKITDDFTIRKGHIFVDVEWFVQTEEFGYVAYVSFCYPTGYIEWFPLYEGEWGFFVE